MLLIFKFVNYLYVNQNFFSQNMCVNLVLKFIDTMVAESEITCVTNNKCFGGNQKVYEHLR